MYCNVLLSSTVPLSYTFNAWKMVALKEVLEFLKGLGVRVYVFHSMNFHSTFPTAISPPVSHTAGDTDGAFQKKYIYMQNFSWKVS